jgi:acyl-CoA reductase-like NAD-dependent aldehyde dehydrogenase
MSLPIPDVRKTYKLYVNGVFPRSESGRTYPVHDTRGRLVANAVLASRKDLRDAVSAARAAQSGWAARSAYNRAQILYRIAEVLQGRREQFVTELRCGSPAAGARREVDATIERLVWYAGWADKFAQISGAANPVDGPFFNFTVPEPVGVVGIVCPDEAPLLALVSRVAPCVVSGNTTVVLASSRLPLVAITLGEALATSDVPGGVINILTGSRDELVPWMAGHADIDTVDLTGCTNERALVGLAERAAAESVSRVVHATAREQQWFDEGSQSPHTIGAFVEYKTVWHPKGQ